MKSLRKPTRRPSGEKKGEVAPSVPGTAMAWSWLRARIKSCERGPPMYASRDPSGEMATRPDQGVLGAIASVESIASMDRTTCFAGAGRSQPQIAVAEIRMTSAITAYNTIVSRRLRSLTVGVDAATDDVTNGLSGAAARCLGARGTAQSRGEICDLGIRLHLELLSYQLLVQARVPYRTGAVAGGGEREHELF